MSAFLMKQFGLFGRNHYTLVDKHREIIKFYAIRSIWNLKNIFKIVLQNMKKIECTFAIQFFIEAFDRNTILINISIDI